MARPGTAPRQRQAQARPVPHDVVGQRRDPLQQRRTVAALQQRVGRLVDQPRGQGIVGRGLRVMDRDADQPVMLVPAAGPPVRRGHGRRPQVQAGAVAQQVGGVDLGQLVAGAQAAERQWRVGARGQDQAQRRGRWSSRKVSASWTSRPAITW